MNSIHKLLNERSDLQAVIDAREAKRAALNKKDYEKHKVTRIKKAHDKKGDRVKCECGSQVYQINMRVHKYSKKHLDYLRKKSNDEEYEVMLQEIEVTEYEKRKMVAYWKDKLASLEDMGTVSCHWCNKKIPYQSVASIDYVGYVCDKCNDKKENPVVYCHVCDTYDHKRESSLCMFGCKCIKKCTHKYTLPSHEDIKEPEVFCECDCLDPEMTETEETVKEPKFWKPNVKRITHRSIIDDANNTVNKSEFLRKRLQSE